jgi:hypothetical protein
LSWAEALDSSHEELELVVIERLAWNILLTVVEYLELGFDDIREVFMREMQWPPTCVAGHKCHRPNVTQAFCGR